jgi:hypothetical protein
MFEIVFPPVKDYGLRIRRISMLLNELMVPE